MTDFQIWWENFPKGNGFAYKGRKFKRTRALRCNETKCEKKFNDILKKKKLTVEEMVGALQKELKSRMDESIRTGFNQFTYMSNSYAYLNGGNFEAWMDDEEDNDTIVKGDELIDPKNLF